MPGGVGGGRFPVPLSRFTIVLISWFCISARAPRQKSAIERVGNGCFGGILLAEMVDRRDSGEDGDLTLDPVSSYARII